MTTHKLRVGPETFDAIFNNRQRADIRHVSGKYQSGDFIQYVEQHMIPATDTYEIARYERKCVRKICHVTSTMFDDMAELLLSKDMLMLSIEPLSKAEKEYFTQIG